MLAWRGTFIVEWCFVAAYRLAFARMLAPQNRVPMNFQYHTALYGFVGCQIML